jgi:ClpX C4-type zinc finger protein
MGSRQPGDQLQCSFCDKTLAGIRPVRKKQDAAAKLISSPSYPRTYICVSCIRICSAAIGDVPAPSGHRSVNARACSFCYKGPHEIRLVASPGNPPEALICEECLAVCTSILQGDNPSVVR